VTVVVMTTWISAAVAQAAPTASFSFAPQSPFTGEPITFTSTATGTVTTQAWDLDGDRSCDDASGATAQASYATSGVHSITLCVGDGAGGSASQTQPVTVYNRPPVAAFTLAPATPLAAERIALTSYSSDPDGPLVSQAWDLDGDGQFDDAQGPSTSVAFPVAGDHMVRLQVIDRDGAANVAERAIEVHAPVAQFLAPFPVVRVVGAVGERGTRIREILVTVPAGSRVEIRCRGRGCPSSRAKRGVLAARTMHVRRFARRVLRPGAVVQIFVTKPGTIGKYTRLRIRAGKGPSRVDRCLPPGAARPARCPG
jgi:hypothetical protein